MSVIASFYLYFVIEMFIFRGKMSVTVIPTTEWSTVKIEAESHASESWREDNIDNLMNKDLALIMSSMKGALAQVSDQLQFLWQIKECGDTVVVEVREEKGEEVQRDMKVEVDKKVGEDERESVGASIEPLRIIGMGDDQDNQGNILDDNDYSSDDYYNSENDDESDDDDKSDDDKSDDDKSNFDSIGNGGSNQKRIAKSVEPKVLTSTKLGRPRNGASMSKSGKRGKPAKKETIQIRRQKRQTAKKCDHVAKVIDALETDLAENFACERLKLLFENVQWKYRSLIIAAVYLLPKGVSPEAIKKFVFHYILPVSEYSLGRGQIMGTCAKLTKEGILRFRGHHTTNTSLRYPATLFRSSLPMNHPVNLHDTNKCAAFQAKYSVHKMLPIIKKGRKKSRLHMGLEDGEPGGGVSPNVIVP